MLRPVAPIFLCIIALAATANAQITSRSERRLLIPGDVMTLARPTLGAEPWYGLYRTTSGVYELRRTTVTVEDTPRGCGGTGRRISAADSSSPLVFIAGLPTLREGPVDTAFAGSKFIYPAESVTMRLGTDNWYALSAFGTAKPGASEVFVTDYDLVLRIQQHSQVVASFPRLDWDGPPKLLWAGDLDRDGRLDVLADLRQSYVGHRYVLLVSSLAPRDSLVVRAAEFITSGC